MIATAIANTRKKQTDKIVPQIIQVTHATSRIITIKILNGTIRSDKSGVEL